MWVLSLPPERKAIHFQSSKIIVCKTHSIASRENPISAMVSKAQELYSHFIHVKNDIIDEFMVAEHPVGSEIWHSISGSYCVHCIKQRHLICDFTLGGKHIINGWGKNWWY